MKKLLLLVFFSSLFYTLPAFDFEKGKIIYKNGSERVGYVKFLELSEKSFIFETSIEGEREKIHSDSIKTIVFEDGSELDYLPIFKYILGVRTKQCHWMKVLRRGFVSVYVRETTHSRPMSFGANGTMTSVGGTARFTDYFAKRETEDASSVICTVATLGSNASFKHYAKKYFEDYPQLVYKIDNNVFTYKNILDAVQFYNDWIEEKAQNKE